VRTPDKDTGLLDVNGKPLLEQGEVLPFPHFYKKVYSHPDGAVVYGAPKWGTRWLDKVARTKRELKRSVGAKPRPYKVWHDRSLRRVDRLIMKNLEGLTPEQQAEWLDKVVKQQLENEAKKESHSPA